MAKRLPKSAHEILLPEMWRGTRRAVARARRIVPTKKRTKHFAGGPTRHRSARCPSCKDPWVLLWDLDLSDRLVPDNFRKGYAPATRLPFYICWKCLAASYEIVSDSLVRCFPFDIHSDSLEEDESPFQEAPAEIPRRHIALEMVPSMVDALLSLDDAVGFDELDDDARRTLEAYLGREIRSDWDVSISQFGGQPLPSQRHSNRVCPNPKCPASRLTYPYGEREIGFLMKELALIDWRDEPVLAEHCFQILYYVCTTCAAIRAEYRCS